MMRVADQVVFYTGMFKPHLAQHVRRAMLSYNCLEARRSDFAPPALDWMLDSGAFTRIVSRRGHVPVAEYAAAIRRWEQVGRLRAAVSQDYMCEDFVLGTTGLSVREHQDLTTGRYLELLDALGEQPYVMPVIQGYAPDEYAYHCWTLAPHLPEGALVGVGSICKRNSRPEAVAQVLNACTPQTLWRGRMTRGARAWCLIRSNTPESGLSGSSVCRWSIANYRCCCDTNEREVDTSMPIFSGLRYVWLLAAFLTSTMAWLSAVGTAASIALFVKRADGLDMAGNIVEGAFSFVMAYVFVLAALYSIRNLRQED